MNKKLFAMLLSLGLITSTLTGCGHKEYNDDEITFSQTAESEDYYEEGEYVEEDGNLVNISGLNEEDTIISTSDGLKLPLSTYKGSIDNEYYIPGDTFTISYDKDNQTYSYDVNNSKNGQAFVAVSENQTIIESYKNIDYNELKDTLYESNINLNNLYSESDDDIKIIRRTGKVYEKNDLVYSYDAIFINNQEVYSHFNDGQDEYNSILNRGNGENNIGIISNTGIHVNYKCSYLDNYDYLEKMENNANYFFNRINNTTNEDYYSSGYLDYSDFTKDGYEVTETIDKYFDGEDSRLEYLYKAGDFEILSFGQYDYSSNYYLNDENGFINLENNSYQKQ